MRTKLLSIILIFVLAVSFSVTGYASNSFAYELDGGNEKIVKAPPDLGCPNNCGNLGIIEDSFYDPTDYLLVYFMYCEHCDTHWYIFQEVNHFRSQQR